jgi:hypothetical protein
LAPGSSGCFVGGSGGTGGGGTGGGGTGGGGTAGGSGTSGGDTDGGGTDGEVPLLAIALIDGRPARGALVVLVGAEGRLLAAARTGEDGTAWLSCPATRAGAELFVLTPGAVAELFVLTPAVVAELVVVLPSRAR